MFDWTDARLFIGAAFCVVVFVLCAVAAPVVAGFDEAVLQSLRDGAGAPLGPYWLREVMTDFTALAGWPVVTLATILICAGLLLRDRRDEAAIMLAVSVGHSVLVEGLKALFARPRPDVVLALADFANHSFPSGHSASAAALYLAIAMLLARRASGAGERAAIFAAAGVLIGMIGISRVYLGVHYPTDVIAGFAAGAGWTCLVFLAARIIGRRRGH